MRLFRFIGSILFPPRCAVCGELLPIAENKYDASACLCEGCRGDWERAKLESCPECLCPSHMCLCSSERGKLKKYVLPKLLTYTPGVNNTQNKIIYAAKHTNETRITDFLASELCVSLCRYLREERISPDECLFSYVPRRRSAISEYGFDQGKRLAREMSRICEGEFCELFSRRRGREQKKLGIREREKNVEGAIRLRRSADKTLRGRVVILVDDLVTTGATLGTAASLVRRAGAERAVVCSIARTTIKGNG